MRKNHIRKLAILFIVLATTAIATAQKSKPKTKGVPAEPLLRGSNTKEGASQANKSAKVLKEIMGAPDKGIPADLCGWPLATAKEYSPHTGQSSQLFLETTH